MKKTTGSVYDMSERENIGHTRGECVFCGEEVVIDSDPSEGPGRSSGSVTLMVEFDGTRPFNEGQLIKKKPGGKMIFMHSVCHLPQEMR